MIDRRPFELHKPYYFLDKAFFDGFKPVGGFKSVRFFRAYRFLCVVEPACSQARTLLFTC